MFLDMCISAYPNNIKVLVLTGGECFLLGKDLIKIVEYASSKNLIVRIVTNGYWAKNYDTAYNKLKMLTDVGLKEINFSTGDDHQEWVKYDNIVYSSIAALDLGLTCVINVETHDNSSFDSTIFLKDDRLKPYLETNNKRIRILNGVWVQFSKDVDLSYNNSLLKMKKERCTSLFNTITINPYSFVIACCGLYSERILPLRLGRLDIENSRDIKSIYESQFEDFVKLWLFVDGPYKILEWLYSKQNINKPIPMGHICMLCANIFKNRKNIETIKNHYDEIFQSVLFRYQLLIKSNNL